MIAGFSVILKTDEKSIQDASPSPHGSKSAVLHSPAAEIRPQFPAKGARQDYGVRVNVISWNPGLTSRISAKQRRSVANRAAYLRRMPLPTIPEEIIPLLSQASYRQEYYDLYERFLDGDDMLSFDAYDLEKDDFEALAGLPPYPLDPNMVDDRERISAAVHGYMVHKYVESLESDCSAFRQMPPTQVAAECRARHSATLKEWSTLKTPTIGGASTPDTEKLTKVFVSLNRLWVAKRLQFAVDDLQMLQKNGTSGLITQLHERRWILRQKRTIIYDYEQ